MNSDQPSRQQLESRLGKCRMSVKLMWSWGQMRCLVDEHGLAPANSKTISRDHLELSWWMTGYKHRPLLQLSSGCCERCTEQQVRLCLLQLVSSEARPSNSCSLEPGNPVSTVTALLYVHQPVCLSPTSMSGLHYALLLE